MSTILKGTIEQGMIRPEESLRLPEGRTVRFELLPEPNPSWNERVQQVVDSFADVSQEDLDDLDAIIALRKNDGPRGVEE